MPRGRRNYNSAQSDLESNARSARSFSFRIPEVHADKIEAIQRFIHRKRKRAYKELMAVRRAASEAAAAEENKTKRIKSGDNHYEQGKSDEKNAKNDSEAASKVEAAGESSEKCRIEEPESAPVSDSGAILVNNVKSDEARSLETNHEDGQSSASTKKDADMTDVSENESAKDDSRSKDKKSTSDSAMSDETTNRDDTEIESDLIKSISEEETKAKQLCEDKATLVKVAQDDVVDLNKTKSQMIWLLKQVITLEAKRKMAAAKKKK